jgi:hypothetical protein
MRDTYNAKKTVSIRKIRSKTPPHFIAPEKFGKLLSKDTSFDEPQFRYRDLTAKPSRLLPDCWVCGSISPVAIHQQEVEGKRVIRRILLVPAILTLDYLAWSSRHFAVRSSGRVLRLFT